MHFVVRLWLVAFTTLAVAESRPLIFEEPAVIPVSEVTYTSFGGAVAIDGLRGFAAVVDQRCSEEFQRVPT
jgi:hypothetical protein